MEQDDGRQGHRFIQVGMSLFLGALVVGVAVPFFRVPRLGLATHLLALTQGLFLMILGLFWARLRLGPGARKTAFGMTLYGCLAPLLANFLAAVWGAGNVLLPMAAGAAHGSALQEGVIAVLLRSGGAVLIGASGLILWGLRLPRRT
ncbi:MAG TPA: hydrogenase [Vicinamibacteria bacterium]|nr:hydrogenase [Vicinamibacteria bacterium]